MKIDSQNIYEYYYIDIDKVLLEIVEILFLVQKQIKISYLKVSFFTSLNIRESNKSQMIWIN